MRNFSVICQFIIIIHQLSGFNIDKYQVNNIIFIDYKTITESGTCKHVNDLPPIHCLKKDVTSEKNCADECSSLKSCVAYAFGTREKFCYLIPSAGGCPLGWKKDGKAFAQNFKELKTFDYPDYVCKAKRLGE